MDRFTVYKPKSKRFICNRRSHNKGLQTASKTRAKKSNSESVYFDCVSLVSLLFNRLIFACSDDASLTFKTKAPSIHANQKSDLEKSIYDFKAQQQLVCVRERLITCHLLTQHVFVDWTLRTNYRVRWAPTKSLTKAAQTMSGRHGTIGYSNTFWRFNSIHLLHMLKNETSTYTYRSHPVPLPRRVSY